MYIKYIYIYMYIYIVFKNCFWKFFEFDVSKQLGKFFIFLLYYFIFSDKN